ncbi:MAG: nuclear transport factor 2 family protein [Archangiaceae bacterium]|nr:nuclear transport factor 2 family protein [Archangiaceae bacterium]
MTAAKTEELVRAYYQSWTKGPGTQVDVAKLKELFAQDLVFEGPIAGRRVGAPPLIEAVAGIGSRLKSMKRLTEVYGESTAAVMYELDLTAPAGVTRFAEFFTVTEGKISTLRLSYDPTEFKKLGATPAGAKT